MASPESKNVKVPSQALASLGSGGTWTREASFGSGEATDPRKVILWLPVEKGHSFPQRRDRYWREELTYDSACCFLRNATTADVAGLATELGLSQATAYRLIKLFCGGETVLSLVDSKRGRPEGHRTLDAKREEIVRTTINAFYLKRTRPAVSQLVRDVQTNCMSVGLKPPHRRTIVARLEDIDLQKRARRRCEKRIVKATIAVPGAFGSARPLKVVQIDHTKADVFVVE